MASKNKTSFLPKNIQHIAIFIGLILLIPLFGVIFVAGWKWDLLDFISAGIILLITGLAIDFAVRKITNPAYRVIAISVVLLAFFIIWVEAATGGVSRTLMSFF